MPKSDQEELKKKLSSTALQACQKDCLALDILLNRISANAKTDPGRKTLLIKYADQLKALRLLIACFYSKKDISPNLADEVLGPLVAHLMCETWGWSLFGDSMALPVALGVVGMVYGRYTNLGEGFCADSMPVSSIVKLDDLQKNIEKYFVGPNTLTQNEQDTLMVMLCLMLRHTEARLLNELLSTDEANLRGARTQGFFGTIGAIVSCHYGLPIWSRTFFTAMTGYFIADQREERYGLFSKNLLTFKHNNEELFFLGLALLCTFYIEKDDDINVSDLFSSSVMRKAYAILLKNGKKTLFEETVGVSDGVRNLTPEFLWLTQYDDRSFESFHKRMNRLNRQPPAFAKQTHIAIAPQLSPIGYYPSREHCPKNSVMVGYNSCSTDTVNFQRRIKNIISKYNSIQASLAHQCGWSQWLEDQLRILCIYKNLWPSFTDSASNIKIILAETSEALQKIFIFRRQRKLISSDWLSLEPMVFDHIKAIAQEHFSLQIDLVSYFEACKQFDVAYWMAGFYPYTPHMIDERVHLCNFSDQLLKNDIQLREVGSSLYWPKTSEDIDLIVWSKNKTSEAIFEELNKLSDFGWYPSQRHRKDDTYSSISYHHASYKSLDIVVYHEFSSELLRENLASRLINITSAITNIGFSWVYLLTNDAKGIYKNEIECSSLAVENIKSWKILTKVVWKMNYQELTNYGDNLNGYRQRLYGMESEVTLLHLIQLMNQAVTPARIEGLRNLYLDILSKQNLTIFIPTFLEGSPQIAHEKFERYIKQGESNCTGWLVVLFYGINKEEGFFALSKLGLTEDQITQLEMLRKVCLLFNGNPFSNNLVAQNFQGVFKSLFLFCRDYCIQKLEPAERNKWKSPLARPL